MTDDLEFFMGEDTLGEDIDTIEDIDTLSEDTIEDIDTLEDIEVDDDSDYGYSVEVDDDSDYGLDSNDTEEILEDFDDDGDGKLIT